MNAPVQGVLQNPGDTLQLVVGGTGVGNPSDVSAIFSLTGSFQGAVVAIEGVPLGQPVVPGTSGVATSPASVNSWVDMLEINYSGQPPEVPGALSSSPVGPLSSAAGPGNGFVFNAPVALYQLIRLRLVSTGGGAIQAGIATVPFPLSSGGPVTVAGTIGVSGGVVQSNQQALIQPVFSNWNPIVTANVPGLAWPMQGDQLEGQFVLDNRVRIRLDRIEEWLKRIQMTLVLLFKSPELSVFDTLAAVNTDMSCGEDPMQTAQAVGDFQAADVG